MDPEFGTGAVKITPAHDPNDFALGRRHNLPMINIFTDDGKINEIGGSKFQGMQRFDARKAILAELTTLGQYKETKNNKMVLPICTRSGNVVEPLLKPQWYVRSEEMSNAAMDAVKNGDLEIQPAVSEREWFSWLGNPIDWCISRQLWWGHRIPAYLISIKGCPMDVRSITHSLTITVNQRRSLGIWPYQRRSDGKGFITIPRPITI